MKKLVLAFILTLAVVPVFADMPLPNPYSPYVEETVIDSSSMWGFISAFLW